MYCASARLESAQHSTYLIIRVRWGAGWCACKGTRAADQGNLPCHGLLGPRILLKVIAIACKQILPNSLNHRTGCKRGPRGRARQPHIKTCAHLEETRQEPLRGSGVGLTQMQVAVDGPPAPPPTLRAQLQAQTLGAR